MRKLALLCCILASSLPLLLFSQTEADFFGFDTLSTNKKIVLPLIYFPEGSASIDKFAKQEISYIAFMLHLHPEAILRIKPQVLYKRFERKPRRLNKKRMKRIKKLLKKDYQIPRKRGGCNLPSALAIQVLRCSPSQ